MYSRYFLFRETIPVVIGQVLCTAAMLGIFLLAGSLDSGAVRGSIAGSLISLGNFLLMVISAGLAADRAAQQGAAAGQKVLQLSYLLRMVGLLVTLMILASSGRFHALALALPLLFTRPILTIHALFSRKGGS